jgi:hypothetical protein
MISERLVCCKGVRERERENERRMLEGVMIHVVRAQDERGRETFIKKAAHVWLDGDLFDGDIFSGVVVYR